MLGRMCAGFGMVGLAGLLGPRALAGSGSSGAMAGPHFAPRARRVIFLFLNGGPSHVDTFDPKPALKKYAGEKPEGDLYRKNKVGGFMPSPFEFTRCGQSGIEVCDTLPNLGRIIDDCCVIRSMKTDTPNHEPALLQMHTGNIQPIRPSMGSWLLYGLGTENHNLPGYVVLRPTPKIVVGPALWSNSFLPAEYQAASVITADMRVDKLVANIRNPNLTAAQQREQLDLLDRLNGLHASAAATPNWRAKSKRWRPPSTCNRARCGHSISAASRSPCGGGMARPRSGAPVCWPAGSSRMACAA